MTYRVTDRLGGVTLSSNRRCAKNHQGGPARCPIIRVTLGYAISSVLGSLQLNAPNGPQPCTHKAQHWGVPITGVTKYYFLKDLVGITRASHNSTNVFAAQWAYTRLPITEILLSQRGHSCRTSSAVRDCRITSRY